MWAAQKDGVQIPDQEPQAKNKFAPRCLFMCCAVFFLCVALCSFYVLRCVLFMCCAVFI